MKIAENNFKYILEQINYDFLSQSLEMNKIKLMNMKLGRTKINLESILKMCEVFNLNINDFCTKRIKINFEFERNADNSERL